MVTKVVMKVVRLEVSLGAVWVPVGMEPPSVSQGVEVAGWAELVLTPGAEVLVLAAAVEVSLSVQGALVPVRAVPVVVVPPRAEEVNVAFPVVVPLGKEVMVPAEAVVVSALVVVVSVQGGTVPVVAVLV